jgi:iron complex transport system ATP-binding protein
MSLFAAQLEQVDLTLDTRTVLGAVSIQIPAGQISAIVGPNGCGKSTLARMLCGFLYPTRGGVTVLGHRLGQVNVHDLRHRVKLVQPTPVHEPDFRMTVFDVILTGAFGTIDLHDEVTAEHRARAEQLVQEIGLQTVRDSAFRICSSGERMRTQIARALMTKPELLLLDEPTTGLDLPSREQLLATLDWIAGQSEAPAILIITHHLEELPIATKHAILMSRGKVVAAGEPASVLTSEQLTHAFELPIEVHQEAGRFYAKARGTQRIE